VRGGLIGRQVELLVEICRDYHDETLYRPVCHRLPEPPDQRDMLKAEIKFFVQSIQEKAKAHGRFVVHSRDSFAVLQNFY